jgi:hypothetical protein
VASDGEVATFDAPFYGSMGGKTLAAPVVGMAAAPGGRGYWLVAADGGIFSFGHAPFHGSMGGKTLSAPVTGMAADPVTGGYWLVASDGGVFSFDAPFEGSAVSTVGLQPARDDRANPFTAIAASQDGDGYVLLPTDPAVEPGVAGRSGFDLAKQEWEGDGALACAGSAPPLIQAAQYLLIGERVDGGDTRGYPAAVDDFEQLFDMPEMSLTPAQAAEVKADTAGLNAFFGTSDGSPCF